MFFQWRGGVGMVSAAEDDFPLVEMDFWWECSPMAVVSPLVEMGFPTVVISPLVEMPSQWVLVLHCFGICFVVGNAFYMHLPSYQASKIHGFLLYVCKILLGKLRFPK
jgi:hypothetical protein